MTDRLEEIKKALPFFNEGDFNYLIEQVEALRAAARAVIVSQSKDWTVDPMGNRWRTVDDRALGSLLAALTDKEAKEPTHD